MSARSRKTINNNGQVQNPDSTETREDQGVLETDPRRSGTSAPAQPATRAAAESPGRASERLGGHDLALVQLDRTTYFVSIHGRTHHDADVAMLIAILLTARAPH